MQEQQYDWQRYVIASDKQLPLTNEGFLDPPYGPHVGADIVADIELIPVPCIVLLGEMGIGKSALMEKLREETDRRGIPTLAVRLRLYTDERRLEDQLFDSPQWVQWRESTTELHIFIDGFDECAARIPALGALIVDRLAEISQDVRARLSIRIACRAVEWKASQLELGLKRLWEDDGCRIYTVAPLRESDVYAAAEQRLPDAYAFMAALRSRRVAPLAARPMTLRHLLNLYEGRGTFPDTQREVYEQAYSLLCEDTTGSHNRRLDAGGRLQVASRIAALMLLTNTTVVVDAPSTYEVADGELALRQLDGEHERVGHQMISVSAEEVRDALNTGLFSPPDSSRFTWMHRSAAEYLAARYLAQSSLSTKQVFQLLQHPADPTRRIVPHLHAVAAWYANFNPEAFRQLLDTDAEVLLNADLGAVAAPERVGLVKALLRPSDEAGWRRLNATAIFPHLAHPVIGEQLSNAVSDSRLPRNTRLLAIDIANSTDAVSAIENALLPIIFNAAEDIMLRSHAAYAVMFRGRDGAKTALAPLALIPRPDDMQDELKGCALRAAWPLALSTVQVLNAITPIKIPNLFGIYRLFLDELAKDLRLADADVPFALEWAASDEADRFGDIVAAIKRRAWSVMHQPSVAEAYARLAVREIRQTSHLEHGGDDESLLALIAAEHRGRHAVVRHLVPLLRDSINDVMWVIYGDPGLLDLHDFDWLLERLAASAAEDTKSWLALIAQMVSSGTDASHVEMYSTIFERQEEIPALRGAFVFEADLRDAEARNVRAEWHRFEQLRQEQAERAARREQQRPDVGRGIATLLARIETGDTARYWSLDSLLATTDGRRRVLDCDLRRLSPWEGADHVTRTRILDAAYAYVRECDDGPTSEWLGTNAIFFPALAGFRALYLLWEERRDVVATLGSDVWTRWATAIVGCAFNPDEASRSIIQSLFCLAYRNARDVTLAALDTQIAYEIGDGYVPVVEHLAQCWDETLEERVLSLALDISTPVGPADQLLQQLYCHRPETTEHVMRSLIRVPPPTEEGERERMVIASRMLLAHSPAVWPDVFRAMLADETFARALVAHIAYQGGIIDLLPDGALADLYIWLEQHYPRSEDPNYLDVHEVTRREQIGMWRDTILQVLASREGVAVYEAFRRITDALPNLPWLRRYLRNAEFSALNHTWKPLSPADLFAAFRDARLRIVRNEEQLLEVLVESLDRLNVKLQAETALARFLWYPRDGGAWRPQDESYLSDLIRVHLDYDLVAQGIILNREVQIRGGLDRFDIKVDAIVRGDRPEVEQLTVIIEVKGSWNRELFTSLDEQLVARYLARNRTDVGIYAVGWYQCAQWRGTRHRSYTIETTRDELVQQARRYSTDGKVVQAIVFDARFSTRDAEESANHLPG